MRKSVVAILGCLTLGLIGIAGPASATGVGNQGCTPGYWKNHTSNWQEVPPSRLFSAPFSPGTSGVLQGLTLEQTLAGGGGPGVAGAEVILARAATAAFLNAAHDGVLYPWRRSAEGLDGRPPLLATVNAALASGDRQTMIDLASRLDTDNNLGCPLN